MVVGLGEELKSVKEKYLAVLEHFVKRLSQCGVLGEAEIVKVVWCLVSSRYIIDRLFLAANAVSISNVHQIGIPL